VNAAPNSMLLSERRVSPNGQDAPSLGETRQVSILFADVVGSSRLIRDMDTEDARDLLDQAIGDIKEAVHAFGGLVARIQGDGVMAIFGVMAAIEDHAQRATFAAMQIRDTAIMRANSAKKPVSLRVGVHSGPIFLRWQDNDFGRVLDAVGSAAHVAARIEHLCPPNSATISAVTLEMLNDPIDAHEIDTISHLESAGNLKVYELSSASDATKSSQLVNSRLIHPLIGRELQLIKLRHHIRSLADGKGDSIGIIGEPGIGKSRLLQEAVQIADQMKVPHLTLRGTEILNNRPFGTLIPILQKLHANAGNNESSVANDTVHEDALTHSEFESLEHLVKHKILSDAPLDILTPDERYRLILSGSIKLLIAQSKDQPLLILIDDLQYLDTQTRTLLSLLVKQVKDHKISMIMAGRTFSLPYLLQNCSTVMQLEALDPQHTNKLIQAILCSNTSKFDHASSHLIEEISIRADGLPLAIEEFSNYAIRMRVDDEGGSELRLPPKLENIFRARIDALQSSARDLCEICCVIGTAVTLPMLVSISEARKTNFESNFQILLDSKILAIEMSGRIRFSHQLFQEAGYQAIPRERLKLLHSEIYRALVAASENLEISHQELARHAKGGGLYQETLKHMWKACEDAIAHAAIESVFNTYKEAQAVCAELGAAGQLSESRFSMLAIDAAQQLAKQDECRSGIQAVADEKVITNQPTILMAKCHLAMIDWIGGRGPQAFQFARAASAEMPKDAPLPLSWFAEFTLGNTEFATGAPRQGFDRLTRLIEKLSGEKATDTFGSIISIPGIMARSFASWHGTDLGQYELAERYAQECNHLADKIDHLYSRLISRLAEGYLKMRQGKLEQACLILTEGREYCLAHNFQGLEPMASSWLALSLIERGKIFQAQKILDESFNNAANRSVRNSCYYYLLESKARLFFACGEAEEALNVIEGATQRCIEQNDLVHVAYGQALIGEYQLGLFQDKDEIVSRLRGVLANADAMGMRPLAERISNVIAAQS
jgi:class 3 adenylate cyclase/ABC-type dipeptide/oligopeptide/nickel transport system ATPase subunit